MLNFPKITLLTLLFSIIGGGAGLSAKPSVESPRGAVSQAQTPQVQNQSYVSGTVRSEDGEYLIGVGVYIKGTKIGVATDIDGKYSIKAPATGSSYVLVFQYVGFETKEFVIKETRSLNVILKQDNKLEGSVIVGAYGTKQTREDLVGSAFQISSDAIKDKPKARLETMLQGLVPGMMMQDYMDTPGSTYGRINVRIRGDASLSASSNPLWIVDGVPYYTGDKNNAMVGMQYTLTPLSFLNPDDIESITVLKDADQTTIYGADGSNGVILVTTKSGNTNRPLTVSASVNVGITMPDYSTMVKNMNAKQFLEVSKEAWTNTGYSMSNYPFQDNDMNSYSTTSTDWAREYLGVGNNENVGLVMSAGTSKTSSQTSLSYFREDNMIKSNTQNRLTLSTKNNFYFNKWIDLLTNVNISYNTHDLFNVSHQVYESSPIMSPYNDDGSYRLFYKVIDGGGWTVRKFFDNEIPEREESTYDTRNFSTMGNLTLNIHVIKGLDISAQASLNYNHYYEKRYTSQKTVDGLGDNNQPTGSLGRSEASYMTFTNIDKISYNRTFGQHTVNAYLGMELNSQNNKSLYASVSRFVNDRVQEIEYGDKTTLGSNSSSSVTRKMSFFARASYSFAHRYDISANFRREGCSGFMKYTRWNQFWSVGAAWNIHREKFFHSDLIKMLKLKASFGYTGNSRIDTSVGTGTYNYSSSYSYGGKAGATLGTVPNPGLSWERNRKINVGARIELKKVLNAEVEFYDEVTLDMLSRIYVSRAISSDRVYANIGSMRNRGVELSLTSFNFARPNFQWTTTLNLAHNTNKVLSVSNGMTTSFGNYVWQAGAEKDAHYLVRWAGVDPTDGMPMWYDKDGNITKTYSESNRVVLKDKPNSPAVFGGLINNFQIKNWEVNVQINYTIGGWKYLTNASRYFADGYDITGNSGNNQAVEVYYDRWRAPGQSATMPKPMVVSTGSTQYSTRFLYNATAFDLSTVALTYHLPDRAISKMKIRGLSFTLMGNNLYYLTPDQRKGRNSYKTLSSGYPRTLSVNLSINCQF